MTFTFFKFSICWLLLLFLLFFRILREKRLTVWWLLFLSGFGLYLFFYNQTQLKKQIEPQKQLERQHLIVQPDQIRVDGDLVKFTAYWTEGKQKVSSYYQVNTRAEKKNWQEISQTTRLLIDGSFEKISAPTNENQFDYQTYARSQQIVNQVYIESCLILQAREKGLITRGIDLLHGWRQQLIFYFDSLPFPLNGYAKLLLIGYTDADFEQQVSQINKLGLLYLFSLSGMHVVYLLVVLKWICTRLLLTRESFYYLCLGILPVYLVLGGSSASLVRAIWMAWLVIFLESLSFKLSKTSAECLVLLLNLIYSPLQLFSIGFQLSYLLTFILIQSRSTNQLKIGLKMNLYSFPVVLWHTYQWNLLTWILTIAIIPFFEWLILPAVVIGSLFPVLSGIANQVLMFPTVVFDQLSLLPLIMTYGKPPLFLVIAAIIILNLTEVSWFKAKYQKISWSFLLVLYFVGAIMIHFPLFGEVVYFDIGQGDSTLIRTSFNQRITLIDTGGKVSFTQEKWQQRHSKTSGETVIANYLLSKGINRIDDLFLTHQDTDHIGNFPSIAKKITIKRIIIPAGMENNPNFIRRLKQAGISNQKVLPVKTTTVSWIGNFKLVHPFTAGSGENKDSLAVWFKLAQLSFIISGDLDQAGEKQVIKKFPDLQADILKTGHHGSKTSTAKAYVTRLKPRLAVISAGKNNRYGHPHRETLATLKACGIPVASTIDHGMIKIKFSFWGPQLIFNQK